jgi:hypothetical protein
MHFKFCCVQQEEKEHIKTICEMEEKLMTTAFHKLVSSCFTLSFNVSLNHCNIIGSVMTLHISSVHVMPPLCKKVR